MASSQSRQRRTEPHGRSALSALGRRLIARGLNSHALEHVLGLRYPLPSRLELRDFRDDDGPPAAVPVLLFCGRRRLRRDLVTRCFGEDTELLEALGLLELEGDTASAPVAVLPVGRGLAVAAWDHLPDDSSMHLCRSLPRRADSWLDVGTGAAFAPLLCPELAPAIAGTDADGERLELAEIGLALSGLDHVRLTAGDLLDVDEPMPAPALITFNAPVADDLRGLMARFWEQARDALAPGGEIVVHCRADAVVGGDAPGQVVAVRYTPPDAEAFAVVSWRPDLPRRCERRDAVLDERDPHVRRDWILPSDSR